MKNIWEIYPKLTEAVRRDHIALDMKTTGHSFDHTLQVAQCAVFIAEDEQVGKLAGAAGLCHNADRLFQKQLGVGKKDIHKEKIITMVRGWLDKSGEFNGDESARIVKAVLGHSGPNLSDGDGVLIALQDADRITCSMADTLMGAAQFWSELPVIDPKWLTHDPTAHSYKNPKSVLKNQECRLDWIDPASPFCVRLPKAKVMMERRIGVVQFYIREIEEQRMEIGLWPNYPFDEVA